MDSDVANLHAILYAKGHYKQDKKLKGLRVIAGHYGGMDPQYVDDDHLMHYAIMLLETFKPSVKFGDLTLKIFKDSWMWRSKRRIGLKTLNHITKIDIIIGILSELRYMRVDQLPELPEATSSIYPLRRK